MSRNYTPAVIKLRKRLFYHGANRKGTDVVPFGLDSTRRSESFRVESVVRRSEFPHEVLDHHHPLVELFHIGRTRTLSLERVRNQLEMFLGHLFLFGLGGGVPLPLCGCGQTPST